MKKGTKFRKILILTIGCIFSSLLYAIAIKCFIQRENVNMLANGVGGIAIIVSRLFGKIGFSIDVVYSITYALLNVPIMILSYKRIGKLYTIFTLVNIFLASLFNIILPSSIFDFLSLDPIADKILIALAAGVLAGASSGIVLKLGASTGGIDTIITYLGIKHNKQVGSFSFILNAIILLTGGIIFKEWNAMLYTIVFIFVSSQMIDLIYRRTKKRLIKIVTNKKDEISNEILKVSKHGLTIFECEGAYSHSKKYELQTVVLEAEVKDMIALIHSIDKDAFTSVYNCYETKGNYTMPDFE